MPKISGDYQYRAWKNGFLPQRFWHANKFALLTLIGKFSPNDSVLDAGCGSGNTSFYLASKVKKVIGFDQNQASITFANSLTKKEKLTNLEFLHGDLAHLPFSKQTFNQVILLEVVEHLTFSQYQKIIAEIYRVLKPNGYLYLTTPNVFSFWPLLEKFLDLFRLVPSLEEQHILKLSPSKISWMINENGFKVKEKGTMNHFSPWLSLISWKLAQKVFFWEVKYLKKLGPIIWLMAQKDGD